MSDKMTCPACDSYTSAARWSAYHEGARCPHCGLPGEVIRAVEIARERGASEQMVERAAKAEQRAAELAREVGRLRSALDEARRAAERGLKADGKPSEW